MGAAAAATVGRPIQRLVATIAAGPGVAAERREEKRTAVSSRCIWVTLTLNHLARRETNDISVIARMRISHAGLS
jgi:hypothetical protein